MLRKFKIRIDDQVYHVEMEELGSNSEELVSSTAVGQPATTPKPPIVQPESTEAVGKTLVAPMPGTITKILTKVGAQVKAKQPLLILEAMKMENEVVADHAGQVMAIEINEGTKVEPGTPLIQIA